MVELMDGCLEKIPQQCVAVLGGDALGVELHAEDRQLAVLQALHDAVLALGGRKKPLRPPFTIYHQRVVAGGLEG